MIISADSPSIVCHGERLSSPVSSADFLDQRPAFRLRSTSNVVMCAIQWLDPCIVVTPITLVNDRRSVSWVEFYKRNDILTYTCFFIPYWYQYRSPLINPLTAVSSRRSQLARPAPLGDQAVIDQIRLMKKFDLIICHRVAAGAPHPLHQTPSLRGTVRRRHKPPFWKAPAFAQYTARQD